MLSVTATHREQTVNERHVAALHSVVTESNIFGHGNTYKRRQVHDV